MDKNITKIIEITASDGMIEIFRGFVGNDRGNKPEYIYFLKESDRDIHSAISSFNKFWNFVTKRYNEIYTFDLHFVHSDIKIDIVKHIRKNFEKPFFELNPNWSNKLVENQDIIYSSSYFDYEYFIEKLEKFKNRIDIQHWNYIEIKHSEYNNKEDFRDKINKSEISPLKVSGLYSYFLNNKCIYIGKAKNIKNRIESHFLSSRKLDNLSRGEKHRTLFGKYLNEELTIFYTELDDLYNSQIGEELRITLERLLHLKYKPEFTQIKNE